MHEFKYLVSEQDYITFNMYHHLNTPARKTWLQITRWMFPVVAVAIVLYSYIQYQDLLRTMIQLVCFTIVSVVWVLLAKPLDIRLLKVIIKRTIKSMKKQGKLPYNQEVLLRFEAAFFVEITAESETKTKYSSIEKVVADQNAIYIYISVIQAIILPLSAFENQGQKENFWHFINNKAADANENIGKKEG